MSDVTASKTESSTLSIESWESIGVVVGNTSTDSFTFVLRSLKAKLGDIVACKLEVPTGDKDGTHDVIVWGRITNIDRFNPFFPAEAAQELAEENIRLIETVLSDTRDHLEASVLILGVTKGHDLKNLQLSPLTYPVQPSSDVRYPSGPILKQLLTGEEIAIAPLRIGSLIARRDVEVSISAKHVVSRHLAILAMTGGGKTVAARRVIRELMGHRYPLVIFDPHGDYLGLYEKRELFKDNDIRLFFPKIKAEKENIDTIIELVRKVGASFSEPQESLFSGLISNSEPRSGNSAIEFIQELEDTVDKLRSLKKEDRPNWATDINSATFSPVRRKLSKVRQAIEQMERNNEAQRKRFAGHYSFEEMPDPLDEPENIVKPGQVSIFYLAGYDHLTQSAIVSIILERLFHHRATLSGQIPPFQAVIEEAHNFIPSRSEGLGETPSLVTIRKVITEGRKFGTGLIIISQRPGRLDDTTLSQCNSFLVLRLVNPNDKRFVRSVMENLSESDANILQAFGPGEGLVSGQAVKFPLLVKVEFDTDLISEAIQDENFVEIVGRWKAPAKQAKKDKTSEIVKQSKAKKAASTEKPKSRRSMIRKKKS